VANASFESPEGLALDAFGNVYVTDGNRVRKIGTNGIVSTVAGDSTKSGLADGVGTSAQFNGPEGLAVDRSGNIFVVDTYNSTVRMITTNGVVTTQAGLAGWFGISDGVGAQVRFSNPSGVAVDTAGNFYVAGVDAVRKGISLASVVAPGITTQPKSQTVAVGSDVVFTVGVTGTSPLTFHWIFDTNTVFVTTSSSFTLTNAETANEGQYTLLVTNFAGKATSTTAILRVGGAPAHGQTLTDATFAGGVFSVSIQSQAGANYVLEYKDALTDPAWQTVGTMEGTGGGIVLRDSRAAGSTRFYRVLIQ